MKIALLSVLCCFASAACSTVGSYDSARLSSYQAAIVANSMTAELKRYPHATVAPAGNPLFDAFADDLEAKGWELRRSQRYELLGSKWQSEYLRVQASKSSPSGVLVSMKTPYFDVNQGFETDPSGGIYPVTNPTLFLKNYED
jgi:hypothetical protein